MRVCLCVFVCVRVCECVCVCVCACVWYVYVVCVVCVVCVVRVWKEVLTGSSSAAFWAIVSFGCVGSFGLNDPSSA